MRYRAPLKGSIGNAQYNNTKFKQLSLWLKIEMTIWKCLFNDVEMVSEVKWRWGYGLSSSTMSRITSHFIYHIKWIFPLQGGKETLLASSIREHNIIRKWNTRLQEIHIKATQQKWSLLKRLVQRESTTVTTSGIIYIFTLTHDDRHMGYSYRFNW